MSNEPIVSFQSIDGVIDTSYFHKILLVGNSNAATAGIYKDLELLSEEDLKTKFGAGQHLARMAEEFRYQMRNSMTKPKLMARSYQDGVSHTSNIKAITITGTVAKDTIIQVELGSNAPSNIATLNACAISARHTKDANIGQFSKNLTETGRPSLASSNTQVIASPKVVSVEVVLTKGDNASTVATAINTAISALDASPFTSSVASAVVTITSKTKGILANELGIKIPSVDGITVAIAETAATGTVDISAILDSIDENGNKIKDLDFDAIVVPYGYATSNIIDDAAAKMENVTNYSNSCLDYRIYQATAIDANDDSAIDTLGTNNPTSAKGAVRSILVLHKASSFITPVSSTTQRNKIKSKQLNPVSSWNGKIEIGSQLTLSNTIGFKKLQTVLNAMMVRSVYIEKFIEIDFWNKNFTSGEATDIDYNKSTIKDYFMSYYDILAGKIADLSQYAYPNIADFTGIVVNGDEARIKYEKLLDRTIAFNPTTGQLSASFVSEFSKPITILSLINIIQ